MSFRDLQGCQCIRLLAKPRSSNLTPQIPYIIRTEVSRQSPLSNAYLTSPIMCCKMNEPSQLTWKYNGFKILGIGCLGTHLQNIGLTRERVARIALETGGAIYSVESAEQNGMQFARAWDIAQVALPCFGFVIDYTWVSLIS